MTNYTTEYFDELDLTRVSSIEELIDYSREYQEECYLNSSTCIYNEIVEEWLDNGMYEPEEDFGNSIIEKITYANLEKKREDILYNTDRDEIIEDLFVLINANSECQLSEDDFFNEDDILQLAQHYVDPAHYDNPLDEEEEYTDE